MPEVHLHIDAVDPGIATLSWERGAPQDAMIRAVAVAADDALFGQGLRRLEVALPSADTSSRRVALRTGFRLEGLRRGALMLPDGSVDDVVLFARLAADRTDGPVGFSAVMNSALPKKRLIAHVLMRDTDGRVLLCDTQFKADWELPGGIVEPGEAPRIGAIREVRKELGIDLSVGRLLVADWMPPYLGWDDAMELIFDGGPVTQAAIDRFSLQPSEIRSVQLCTLAEARQRVTELSYRRLRIAAELAPDETAYLEDGSLPG